MGKVIEGRFTRPFSERVELIDAQATKTRLMGVVGVVARWRIDGSSTIYQLLHLDYEDYGIDAYDEFDALEKERIEQRIQEMTGGLGGAFTKISYQELAYLIATAHVVDPESPNAVYDFLPNFDFVLKDYENNGLGREAAIALFDRLGPYPQTVCEHLHYYLMRLHGQDAEGILYLGDLVFDDRLDGPKSTLLKNVVKEGDKPGFYRCEALIENENGYFVRIFDLQIETDLPEHPPRWVKSCELKHQLAVSPVEASFMLRKTEYLSLYSVLDPGFMADFEAAMPELMPNSYLAGDLFTEFNQDNAHVTEWIYYLNGDVFANYFITEANQLLVATFDPETLKTIERRFADGPFKDALSKIGDFSADQPLLYDFINSGISDFFEYL
jgi:hypothetical protein